MDFNTLENLQNKIDLASVRKPALIGLTALIVMVAVMAGRYAIDTATATEIQLDRAGQESVSEVDPEASETAASPSATKASSIYVHVSGAVKSPGIVEVPADSRVADAVAAAGGETDDASIESINLARKLDDGEHVHLPSCEEALEAGAGFEQGATGERMGSSGGLVNINTATAEALEELPGIGPATANKIIQDRDSSGPFESTEDLKRVSGIGEKKYAALAELICV